MENVVYFCEVLDCTSERVHRYGDPQERGVTCSAQPYPYFRPHYHRACLRLSLSHRAISTGKYRCGRLRLRGLLREIEYQSCRGRAGQRRCVPLYD